MKELGVVAVLMPPNEVVEATGRGTIDATTTVPAAVVDFDIDRVTSSDYLIRLGPSPFAVLLSRKKYDSLPKAAQDVIAKYSRRDQRLQRAAGGDGGAGEAWRVIALQHLRQDHALLIGALELFVRLVNGAGGVDHGQRQQSP